MPTSILLNGIPFTGTGVYEGFTYDKLTGWIGLPDIDLRMVKRPNQPGAFSVDRTSPEQAVISIEGQFFGATEADAILARERLLTIYNDGEPVTMKVSDAVRVTTREVAVKAIDIPWQFRPQFTFSIDVVAPDPKRYGTPEVVSNGLAVAGSGLVFSQGQAAATAYTLTENPSGSSLYGTAHLIETPVGSGLYAPALQEDPSAPGLYLTSGTYTNNNAIAQGLDFDFGLDFGTTPNDGRLTLTNAGGTETTSTFIIEGGEMPAGAEIINVATGERLVYTGPIVAGTTLEFDPRVQAVFVNGTNPAGRYLPNPDWWAVPAGTSLQIQFLARGTEVTGAPRLRAITAPAWY